MSSTDIQPASVSPDLRRRIRSRLLRWYDRTRRDLPWRRMSDDPYAQWVAEIMLQQTRVETVIPYYIRFMKRFPSVDSLARARHDTVLKHWEGLGYYRRALLLHRGAGQVAAAERRPRTAAEWREIAGVGPYTAAAIASIAHGEPVAAVDGNVARVIARLFALPDNILTPAGLNKVRAVAAALVPRKRPGDFNQAWMDLGSAVCTPRNANCGNCPLEAVCEARATGREQALPVRIPSTRVQSVDLVALVASSGQRILVRQRPRGGLWSGLWEVPSREIPADGDANAALRDLADECLLPDAEGILLGKVEHQLTHRRMCFHLFAVDCDSNVAEAEARDKGRLWADDRKRRALSMSTAHRKILHAHAECRARNEEPPDASSRDVTCADQ